MADEKTVKCRILRDVWDDDGKRHKKGAIVELPVDAAMDGMEAGAVARVKANEPEPEGKKGKKKGK